MLASLGRRARRLVLDDIIGCALLFGALLCKAELGEREDGEGVLFYGNVCCDPVAEFAPFGVVAGWSVWVCERDDVGRV